MWKTSWGLSHWTPMTTQPHLIPYDDDIKKAFLVKEWSSFHLLGKKLDYRHLKDFLKYEYELYLKQSLTPPQRKMIATYHTSNHRLAIAPRRWPLLLLIM